MQHEKDSLEISRKVLEQMSKSCDRQLNLINSLVESQQFDIGGMNLDTKPLNLAKLSQQLATEWQPMLKENKARLFLEVPQDLPMVQADSDRLWRVLENLMANALKHNQPGIQLTLKVDIIVTEKQDLKPQKIRCSLKDNGIGINSKLAETLFERYNRGEKARKTIGLGLGLYLCRQIIEAHGGEIGVVTKPGQGAKFWFTLPMSDS